tara:strand:+ start:75 stop:344 length:270 start_codon:yes stop_codon:yes gene_type:complete
MINVGDLVKRVAVLSVIDDEFGWTLTDEFPDAVGIVLAIEQPTYESPEVISEDILSIGCFIKVIWQTREYGGPVWHWSEELLVINKINP